MSAGMAVDIRAACGARQSPFQHGYLPSPTSMTRSATNGLTNRPSTTQRLLTSSRWETEEPCRNILIPKCFRLLLTLIWNSKICLKAFCGLGWRSPLIQPARIPSPVKTKSSPESRTGLASAWTLGRGRFFRGRGWHGELGVVHRNVLVNLVHLNREAPAGPRDGPPERNFHAISITVIGKIRLFGNAAQGRLDVSNHANQQAGLRIEIKSNRRLTLPQPKDQVCLMIVNLLRWPGAELRKGLLQMHGKVKIGVKFHGLKIPAGHLARPAHA